MSTDYMDKNGYAELNEDVISDLTRTLGAETTLTQIFE